MASEAEAAGRTHAPTGFLPRRLNALFLRSEALRGYLLLSPTMIVMIGTMCVPIGLTIAYSFWTQDYLAMDTSFTLDNYQEAMSREIYRALLLRSLMISGTVTVLTVVIAYPMAYYVAFHVHTNKLGWIILLSIPFLTSYLLRVFAWKVILGYEGVINSGLIGLGLIEEPLAVLLYNPTSVIITLTHAWAAFAILPIFVSLEKIDRSLLEAATDLGDGPVMRFLRVTLPLSLPGVIAASLMIFIPTVGDYVTPDLVGGRDGRMIANIIQAQFGRANNWPLGASLSLIMMLAVTIISLGYILITSFLTKRIS
ncbi:MAG: ABC transporter permease [Rhodovibrionaceae bacterium]